MTEKEKLEKLKKLADAMYYAAQQLTTDASRLHKAMDEYHKFIIHECKEEPASEGLGEYINELSKQFPEVSFAKLSRIAVRIVKWKEQQMMAKAVDAVVKIDAGGYPYVDRTIELYDYDKDIPLAKRGDKVKILVIKES